ncbi:MAG: TA system VapC family ribonuclease toxin [Myxococcota bacterium]
MILLDANVLLYASNELAPQHQRCAAWLEDAFAANDRVGIPWESLLAFVRIATNARALARPLSTTEAWERVEEWLDLDGVWCPTPTETHQRTLGRLLRASRATGNLVSDAHLAALAIDHGLTLVSTDADFAAFPGLRWQNPLR